jgi:GNAT superfamily N-acetyltransferase
MIEQSQESEADMELQARNIANNKEAETKAKALYLSAFPKEERVAWWLLSVSNRWRGVSVDTYYDGDTFCGFTHSIEIDDILFVTFFAVDGSLRAKGYGSAILSHLKKKGRAILLNVEPLLADAPNFEERERRCRFYEKNGFHDTGYYVYEIGGKFSIFSTSAAPLNVKTYKKVFRKMTFGFWNVKVVKNESFQK